MPLAASTQMLTPVVVLVVWSLVMWAWMLVTRVRGMQAARLDPQTAKHTRTGSINDLPSEIRQVGDNYNHLMEQPTIFYALTIAMAVGGVATGLDVALAWGYVGLRVIHSLYQALINRVMIRFYLFIVSSIVLIVLSVRALMAFL